MITPREMLRDYLTVLNIIMQNPEASFSDIVGKAVTLKTINDDDDDNFTPGPPDSPAKKPDFDPNDIVF
jgi:hypothetical protein